MPVTPDAKVGRITKMTLVATCQHPRCSWERHTPILARDTPLVTTRKIKNHDGAVRQHVLYRGHRVKDHRVIHTIYYPRDLSAQAAALLS